MNNENVNIRFEEFVQNSYNVPPISSEFYNNLYAEVMAHAGNIRIVPKISTNLVRIKRFSLVGLTIVLIIAISFLVSPSLRVMAENLFSFWKKVDNQQMITPIPEVPAVDPEKIPAIVESLQEEIKSTQQATASSEEEFIIKLPTLLPEGYRIVTVSNRPIGNAWVDLSSRNKGVYMTLTIQPAHMVEGSIIGPADRIEKVAINDLTGEYVRGGFGVGPWMTGYVKE